MKPDLFWVPGPWSGALAVAARPRGGEWLSDEITGWRESGLEIVLSLLESSEAAELELEREGDSAGAGGLPFFSFPYRTGEYPRP